MKGLTGGLMGDKEYFESVVAAYHESNCSIRETANQMEISRSKVRKILITMGEITSDITEKALPLLAEGKSQKEIAEILGVSVATLSTYLPYGNRVFNREDKTEDAIRSEEYRNRQKLAASRQINNGRVAGHDEHSGLALNVGRIATADNMNPTVVMMNHGVDKTSVDKIAIVDGMTTVDKPSVMTTVGINDMKTMEADNMEEKTDYLEDEIKVVKLKLELQMDEDDREVIKKYGKAKEGISREIIVPYFYPLHSLHYAIQKAFGWQNSHLHHFELPEEAFNGLTDNKFAKYCMLCGLYFRFPYGDEDMNDIYWDDDYSEGISFKTWLKKKYSAPYGYGGSLEHFIFSQIVAKRFWDDNPTIRISPSFDEYLKGIKQSKVIKLSDATCGEMDRFFECGLGEIIERAPISDILKCSGSTDVHTKSAVTAGDERVESAAEAYKAANKIAADLDKRFDVDLEELQRVLEIGEKLEKAMEKKKRLSKRKNTSPITLLGSMEDVRMLKEQYEDGLCMLLNNTNADMPPVCNELVYKYDYGDGWEVKITCDEEYMAGIKSGNVMGFYAIDGKNGENSTDGTEGKNSTDCTDGTDGKNNENSTDWKPMEKELFELVLKKCITEANPLCVAADGLPVMDDVGGVSGYCDFLRCIKNGEDTGRYDDPESVKEWARDMGWTGRMSKAQNIL